MKRGQVGAIVFFSVLFAFAGLMLFIPAVREGTPDRGISGAIGFQGWMLAVLVMAFCAWVIIAIIVQHVRGPRKR